MNDHFVRGAEGRVNLAQAIGQTLALAIISTMMTADTWRGESYIAHIDALDGGRRNAEDLRDSRRASLEREEAVELAYARRIVARGWL